MKGLSPLVATILLVAFVVAIGGLIVVWLTGFATSTTEFTSEQGDKITACAGARLRFDLVSASSIVYSNPSVKTITNITVFDQDGRNLTYNASDLSPGKVGNVTWARGGNTSVFTRGICEESVVVEGECEDGQVCWK